MSNPCYQCGHVVEDGKPFCPGCGAPQIRVAMPEIPAVDAVNLPASPPPVAVLSGSIDWPGALGTCATAALISALAAAVGLVAPLLAGLSAGFLAVSLYHRRHRMLGMSARVGARLGAVGGSFFFGMVCIGLLLLERISPGSTHVRQQLLDGLQQAAARSPSPQTQAVLDTMKTPEGFAVLLILSVVFGLVLSIAAGITAGALTGAYLGRKPRP